MDTSLYTYLQQAWLLTQLNKPSPTTPTPALAHHIDPFPSRASDAPLDPSSDFLWPDFADVSDSWNLSVAPAVSSSSDGGILPNSWAVPAAEAVPVISPDDDAFNATLDPWDSSLTSLGVSSPSDYWMPAPQSSEADSDMVGPEASAGVAPGASSFEDDVLMDPVLSYISGMLMDEDMEDRKCMQQECSAYQAIQNGTSGILGDEQQCSAYQAIHNGFSEILGEDSSSQSSCTERSPNSTGNESKDDYSWTDRKLVADPTSTEQTVLPSPSQLDSSTSSSFRQDSWPFDSPSSGSLYFQDPPVYSSGSHEDGSWNGGTFPEGASILTSSYPVGALGNGSAKTLPPDSGMRAIQSVLYPGFGMRQFDSVAGNSFRAEPPSQILLGDDADDDKFLRVQSEDRKLHTNRYPLQMNGNASDSDKVHDKARQSLGELWKFVENSRHSSNGSYGSVNGGAISRAHDSEKVDVNIGRRDLDHRDVSAENPSVYSDEKLSFVKNKDLNAEKVSKMFGKRWPSDKCSMEAHSNGAQVKRSGKLDSVDLRGLLISCAQAVASNDLRKANEYVQDIRQYASPEGSAAQRLAHYFAEGLIARISGTGARLFTAMTSNRPSAARMLKAYHQFVEVCPYARISHYFANKMILKAAEGASRLHIVDYGILYGFQWPCLISALADRKGGPPFLRITGIDLPHPGLNPAERVQQTGSRLAEYAKTYNVPFDYHAIAKKWEDVEPADLRLKQGEVLAVNCIHRLHQVLDESIATASPRNKVLSRMHSVNPDIVLFVGLNSGHNVPFFVSRFREALYHYSSKFDMMDTTVGSDNLERLLYEKEVWGRDILNVVACEGPERVERPETYRQWQARFQRAGFEQLPLNSSLVSKTRWMVKNSYHKDFGVDEDSEWMLLAWNGRVINVLSAWRPSPAAALPMSGNSATRRSLY